MDQVRAAAKTHPSHGRSGFKFRATCKTSRFGPRRGVLRTTARLASTYSCSLPYIFHRAGLSGRFGAFGSSASRCFQLAIANGRTFATVVGHPNQTGLKGPPGSVAVGRQI